MSKSIRVGRNTCAALALMALSQGAAAQSAFDTPAAFEARVMISGVNRGPIHAGGTAELRGTGFTQGQTVTFERGDEVLFKDLPVNEKGEVSAKFDVPADAALGLHPIVVKTDGPDSASVVELKVSPKIDYAGEDKFDITKAELGGGLYQIGVSDANGTIFVTSSAGGRGKPVTSELIKLDGETLEVLARREPAMAPAEGGRPASPFAVYGVGVDDTHGNVWVTNTRQNSVAVYAQDDLSLVKQFDVNTAPHARDAVYDAATDRVYVSVMSEGINVYDAASLELVKTIAIPSAQRGGEFATMSVAVDGANGQLYTVSLNTPELAKVDLASGEVTIFPLESVSRPSGVDVSEDGKTLFVASQNSDDLLILDAADGSVKSDVPVGVQPLNVVYVEGQDLAYVANRTSDSLAVVSGDGQLVASLPGGPFPNFVEEADDGTVYMVNKARGDAEGGNTVWRIKHK
ncbi:YncE family protein [Paracoccus seriniphilus]|uniref:40-residue YVTN family beta-propeller repeat-containing protein n=1 Tax=Paracoccus seriniphilus TaxID=184748 RepID=A0A239PSE3_9RHOB|nr:YncE family protein [Paracoccus seriniphilus]WCR12939.1 YncE family protein [Paracoccus seriniphilus]SNT72627.1 40-residue YVTN family beta-propeller repeat-containing protein [Paracoccus seriniphilus]